MAKKTGKKAPQENGLQNFCLHSNDSHSNKAIAALTSGQRKRAPLALGASMAPSSVDPETTARSFLQQALESDAVPAFTAPVVDKVESEFKSIGTETIPLTGTTTVKFRQFLNKIPVYGSLIVVELDDAKELVGINSSVGTPKGVSPIAKISAADAVSKVTSRHPEARSGIKGIAPRLNYFFDVAKGKWHLAFIFEDVPVSRTKSNERFPIKMDFVVDAQSGSLVAALDRTSTMAAVAETGIDCLGATRTFQAEKSGTLMLLKDGLLNVQTFDFKGKDPEVRSGLLPGTAISNPPSFSESAVSAHANACDVSRFMRTILMRNNIDGAGGAMISTINCIVVSESEGGLGKEWINAYWDGTQMVYGLRTNGSKVLSMAADLDVVTHEMSHGITDKTSRLEYRFQSGALNESYSDIFGVIVNNFVNTNVNAWNWKIGAGLLKSGRAFRDFANPPAEGQPDHMRNFAVLPNTRRGDNGGVHVNSGIHNKAAHNILTSKTSGGAFMFSPKEVAILFYLALTQQLSRTSQFVDSRRGVVLSARTYFRSLTTSQVATRISAIEKAFDNVGIV